MIGNDVVDLNLAKTQSNWQRKGFLDKVFTKKEQQFIKKAKDSFITVWLLWSMKESVYKIYSRQNNIRFYAPWQFECDINNAQNTVSINGTAYYTSSTISKNSIHTMATLNKEESIKADLFMLNKDTYNIQHATIYGHLKSTISNHFNVPIARLKIEKDSNGIPHIKHLGVTSSLSISLKAGSVEKSSISISHHGMFGAYAFAK